MSRYFCCMTILCVHIVFFVQFHHHPSIPISLSLSPFSPPNFMCFFRNWINLVLSAYMCVGPSLENKQPFRVASLKNTNSVFPRTCFFLQIGVSFTWSYSSGGLEPAATQFIFSLFPKTEDTEFVLSRKKWRASDFNLTVRRMARLPPRRSEKAHQREVSKDSQMVSLDRWPLMLPLLKSRHVTCLCYIVHMEGHSMGV